MSTESETIKIQTEDVTASVWVEPVSDGIFRVAECSWLVEEYNYDDIIEVSAKVGDVYPFVRVVRPSKLHRRTFVLGYESATNQLTAQFTSLLNEVKQAGGYWERAFGGAVFIALPPDAGIDLDVSLAVINKAKRS